MQGFKYMRAESLKQVTAALTEFHPGVRLLAGGTDLLVQMRLDRVAPRVLVDLKRVADLPAGIEQVGGTVRIGARTTLTRILAHPLVIGHFPALGEAVATIGSVQIRNRATLAGNICNASPAADSAPPLLVYGATIRVFGPRGERVIPVAAFFTGPGRTALQPGELVVSIDLPVPTEPVGAAFVRLTRRKGADLATASVACLVSASGRRLTALGAVAPTPVTCDGDGWMEKAQPITDVRGSRAYRLAMLPVLQRRALALAEERLHNRGVASQ